MTVTGHWRTWARLSRGARAVTVRRHPAHGYVVLDGARAVALVPTWRAALAHAAGLVAGGGAP